MGFASSRGRNDRILALTTTGNHHARPSFGSIRYSVICEAQVSVQEYPIPQGLRAHDIWADAAPGGPVYFSAQGSGQLGILDPKSGKV
jgi:streptogramin lyase